MLLITVTIQIGNSDDKLTQREWSNYVADMSMAIERYKTRGHFFGTCGGHLEWQNACWVFEIEEANVQELREEVGNIRRVFRPDRSVNWIEGEMGFA